MNQQEQPSQKPVVHLVFNSPAEKFTGTAGFAMLVTPWPDPKLPPGHTAMNVLFLGTPEEIASMVASAMMLAHQRGILGAAVDNFTRRLAQQAPVTMRSNERKAEPLDDEDTTDSRLDRWL